LSVEAEVAEVEGVGGGDAALEVVEGAVAFVVGLAHGTVFFGLPETVDFVGEELGVDAGEAALEPFGADHGVDGGAGCGGGGPIGGVIFVDEGIEELAPLGGEYVGIGVDSGFEGVEGGTGFAGGGGGAGGVLGVAAVGLGLFLRGHGSILLFPEIKKARAGNAACAVWREAVGCSLLSL
jgi:hypothetical protein